ncbi:hypothetical protein ACFVAV_25580 [Nocardia sp. NPDC057663]|uniref:hypothetical protein n=1 Tax=Nocardia sp. NPDC057663 TaxID=3346201 RepID=UPI00366E0C17
MPGFGARRRARRHCPGDRDHLGRNQLAALFRLLGKHLSIVGGVLILFCLVNTMLGAF